MARWCCVIAFIRPEGFGGCAIPVHLACPVHTSTGKLSTNGGRQAQHERGQASSARTGQTSSKRMGQAGSARTGQASSARTGQAGSARMGQAGSARTGTDRLSTNNRGKLGATRERKLGADEMHELESGIRQGHNEFPAWRPLRNLFPLAGGKSGWRVKNGFTASDP